MCETASSGRVRARCCGRVDGRTGVARGVPRLARGQGRSHHVGSAARAAVRAAVPGRVLPDRRRATGPASALAGCLPARRGAGCAGGLLGGGAARRGLRPDRDVPAEVTVAGGGQRVHDGLVVRRDRIAPGETTWVGGVRCTSRCAPPTTWAVRKTSSRRWWRSTDCRTGTGSRRISCCTSARCHGGPGTSRCTTLAYANPVCGSPMECRLRLIIVQAGLPTRRSSGWCRTPGPARLSGSIGLAGAPHRYRVRGGGSHRPGRGAPRRRALHPAGRPRLADLPVHQVRRLRRSGRIVAELTRALATSCTA